MKECGWSLDLRVDQFRSDAVLSMIEYKNYNYMSMLKNTFACSDQIKILTIVPHKYIFIYIFF